MKDKLSRREREFLCPTPKLHSQLTRVDRDQESIGRDINKIAAAGLTGGKEADALALTPEEEHERAARVREAGFPAYLEPYEGLTRVKVGPFASRAAAEKKLAELEHADFEGIVVPR